MSSTFLGHSLLYLGRIDNMPPELYHSIEAVGYGGVKRLLRSPAHFRAPSTTEPSTQMFNGTLTHCRLLEPEAWDRRYVVIPDMDKRTKAYKDAAFGANLAGMEVVTQTQMDAAQAQADSLRSHPEVARLFEREGANEVSIFWRDPATQVYCKGRIDRVVPTGRGAILFDAKTTSNAEMEAFKRSAASNGYHLQARHYTRGWEEATGGMVASFVIGAVESEPPYCSAVFVYHPDVNARADRDIERALVIAQACDATGEWPGYPQEPQELTLPEWMMRETA